MRKTGDIEGQKDDSEARAGKGVEAQANHDTLFIIDIKPKPRSKPSLGIVIRECYSLPLPPDHTALSSPLSPRTSKQFLSRSKPSSIATSRPHAHHLSPFSHLCTPSSKRPTHPRGLILWPGRKNRDTSQDVRKFQRS